MPHRTLVPALTLLLAAALGLSVGSPAVRGDAAPRAPMERDVLERDSGGRANVPGSEAVAVAAAVCPRCTDMPDLTQSDPALGLPRDGGSYCGPVAVTNGLAWLASCGFPRLLSERGLVEMPRHLAWRIYLKTDPRRGTLPFDLVRGLARWVGNAGYEVDTLGYAGVRDHPANRSLNVLRPGLPLLVGGLERDGIVLLHVGWYEEPRAGRLARVGGHWLTLGAADARNGVLQVHDPAPYASEGVEHITVRELTAGQILRPAGLGHLDARGFLELTEGMRLRSPDERAILDGAVVLRVRGAVPTEASGQTP